MGQNCATSWDVTLHFSAACVACLIAMETFSGKGFYGEEGKGAFLAPPPPSFPLYPAPSACDGAEPVVCYGVSPPLADCTPPVCFDKAPRCPAGRPFPRCGGRGGDGGGSEM